MQAWTAKTLRKNFYLDTLYQYFLAAALSLLLFGLITHAWHLTLSIPFFYSWDSVFSGALVKSVLDTGWYVTNPYIGAPDGFNLADFPMADHLHYFAVKILSSFIHHYAVVMNIFYILTFPIVTVTALFVFKQLKLRYPFALTASL